MPGRLISLPRARPACGQRTAPAMGAARPSSRRPPGSRWLASSILPLEAAAPRAPRPGRLRRRRARPAASLRRDRLSPPPNSLGRLSTLSDLQARPRLAQQTPVWQRTEPSCHRNPAAAVCARRRGRRAADLHAAGRLDVVAPGLRLPPARAARGNPPPSARRRIGAAGPASAGCRPAAVPRSSSAPAAGHRSSGPCRAG